MLQNNNDRVNLIKKENLMDWPQAFAIIGATGVFVLWAYNKLDSEIICLKYIWLKNSKKLIRDSKKLIRDSKKLIKELIK